MEIEDQMGGVGSEEETESREKEERERRKEVAEGPKAPKVSRTKGTIRALEEAAREEYLVDLEVSCRLATARGVGGMER